jgi:hypothetical protein
MPVDREEPSPIHRIGYRCETKIVLGLLVDDHDAPDYGRNIRRALDASMEVFSYSWVGILYMEHRAWVSIRSERQVQQDRWMSPANGELFVVRPTRRIAAQTISTVKRG